MMGLSAMITAFQSPHALSWSDAHTYTHTHVHTHLYEDPCVGHVYNKL